MIVLRSDIMATISNPEKKVFDDTTSDDAVLEQLGYTQGNAICSRFGSLLTKCRAEAKLRSSWNGWLFLQHRY